MTGSRTPQQQGRDFEHRVAEMIGGSVVPGSGAGFSKLDLDGVGSILWSLKRFPTRDSVPVNQALFSEALSAIHGPGGVGGIYLPGVISESRDGLVVASMRLTDMAALLHEQRPISGSSPVSSIDFDRRRPALLRDDT